MEHLKGIELTDEEMDETDGGAPFDIGFPLSMAFEYGGGKYNTRMSTRIKPLHPTQQPCRTLIGRGS